jgi:hypothetical protein
MTDHKPLEKLGKVHKKTLNRLQEMMMEYSFDIIYKPGSEMPADFLSRHAVDSIGVNNEDLIAQQTNDPFLKHLWNFLLHRTLPDNSQTKNLVFQLAKDSFIQDDVLWRRLITTGLLFLRPIRSFLPFSKKLMATFCLDTEEF